MPIALLPLIYDVMVSVDAESRGSMFKKGSLFGFILLGLSHLWLFELTPWAPTTGIALLWIAYSLFLSLFYGAGFYLFSVIYTKKLRWLIFPLIWVLIEWIRAYGPLANTVSSLGYSQVLNQGLLQWASIVGVFGISFILVLFSCIIVECLIGKRRLIWTAVLIFTTVLCTSFSYYIFFFDPPTSTGSIKTLSIQPNYEQQFKMNPNNFDQIRLDLIMQTRIHEIRETELILWPEIITSSLNISNSTFRKNLDILVLNKKRHLIFGTPFYEKGSYFNAAVAFPHYSTKESVYKKTKLMPFGEYWPFRRVFNLLNLKNLVPGADYTPGNTPTILNANAAKIGMAICLESIYPQHFVQSVNKGANLLVTIANNAWFFDSSASKKLLQMTILRAVEQQRSVIQCANTGYSAIISPNGTVLNKIPATTKGFMQNSVSLYSKRSFYTKYSLVLPLLSICILGLLFLLGLRNKIRK
ncbi:apolipoprotein N-acyltransferase [bacterium]|jgi:apolipoprotein N-acyltransferase|nr:apolipoprotein N-acyltransferase [bacterium]